MAGRILRTLAGLGVVLTFAASSAHALSCVPSGITDSYLHAAASDAEFNVLKGRLTFNQRKLDRRLETIVRSNSGGTVEITAQLQGAALGAVGFTIRANVQATLHLTCLGPWCPRATTDRDVILFAEKVDGGLRVRLDACSGDLHALTPESEQDVLTCHQGGVCIPRAEQVFR
ncbi:hypothetical protein KMP13_08075 [Epibacterium ulvae]|uniref:hypothetical protein n=1 Tax=Epibacterium ulvae TaxID=1156985 RepID=UPI001BFC5FCB|nr:hypothetical protein [Epibacterium ulvae]MBT8153851.1 hypothetical protein [Epibacterium ulvae]